MDVSPLAVRLTDRRTAPRHLVWQSLAYGAMAKASVPIPSIRGSVESLIQSGPAKLEKVECLRLSSSIWYLKLTLKSPRDAEAQSGKNGDP